MRHVDERHATLRDIACERCAAVVKVTKFSPQHTSVQWDAQSMATCAEFAAQAANGQAGKGQAGNAQTPNGQAGNGQAGNGRRGIVRTCASLWESIGNAVRDGRLEAGPR